MKLSKVEEGFFDPGMLKFIGMVEDLEPVIEAQLGRARRGDKKSDKSFELTKASYEKWLETLFYNPKHAKLAPHHHEFWKWVWGHEAEDGGGDPFAACWPRGHVKSTNLQRAVVALMSRGVRNYCMYVMSTQDQADNAVSNIEALIARPTVGEVYPKLAQRVSGLYGASKGWRRNRLRTGMGTVDAMGLDTARRGSNVEEQRPNIIVLDDLDGKNDSIETTAKKVITLTESILPMGTDDCIIMYGQNLILPTGIMARIGKMVGKLPDLDVVPADFLTNIIFSGPVSAVDGLRYESYENPSRRGTYKYRITGGVATWEGMNLKACENHINKEGPLSFERERQNVLGDNKLALLSREIIERNRIEARPYSRSDYDNVIISIDPPATTGQCGIIVKGAKVIDRLRHTYRIDDLSTEPGEGPEVWGVKALLGMLKYKASHFVAEINQGGKMVKHVLATTQIYEYMGQQISGSMLTDYQKVHEAKLLLDGASVRVVEVRASSSKRTRAEPVANRDHQGLGHFVGKLSRLESLWCQWVPGMPSPDPLDADVWGEYDLEPTLGEPVEEDTEPEVMMALARAVGRAGRERSGRTNGVRS